jgi:hypothetical protein
MSDSRHRQLSRIYKRTIEDDDGARAAISAEPGTLANALFLEAAESDDVTSVESGRSYLEDRLAFLGNLVAGHEAAIRSEFETRLRAWETV